MHDVWWYEDEVSRSGLGRLLEVIAEPKADAPAQHADHALAVAVVVRAGTSARFQRHRTHPEVLRPDVLVYRGQSLHSRRLGRLRGELMWTNHAHGHRIASFNRAEWHCRLTATGSDATCVACVIMCTASAVLTPPTA